MVKNKNRKKNYPLYETTVFEDFRIMTENVAKKYPDRIAISYKDKPSDKETKTITFAEIEAAGLSSDLTASLGP